MSRCDVAIVGAGIVGLATALRLSERHPDLSIAVVERRDGVALAQSGRNSGVLHSGIYYTPGSVKAETCRRGKALLESFCAKHAIPVNRCGKLIVATRPRELERLESLRRRAIANGVRAVRVEPDDIRAIEPHVRGLGALHVPETGVVDFSRVCEIMALVLQERGVRLSFKAGAVGAAERAEDVALETERGRLGARFLIACAGMDADRFARACGLNPGVRIVPFRGSYALLKPERAEVCRALIYPVPDPRFPFLGAHFTRRIDGRVEVGPTASLSLRRGEDRGRLREARATLASRGLWILAMRHAPRALGEFHRGVSLRALAGAASRLIPGLTERDLERAPSGLRAQAIGPDGRLLDDFAFAESKRMLHVINAPSPAATASLAIADRIVDRFAERLGD